jgi:predicted RNA polymerase sigma factor
MCGGAGQWLVPSGQPEDRVHVADGRSSYPQAAQSSVQMAHDNDPPEPLGVIDDERLRLIFTCSHPALAMEARVALTLRMVGGLTVPEITRAFLVGEPAMEQRITRAKAKIKAARIPYRMPLAEDLQHVSPAYSPSCTSSSTRATWRPVPTPIRLVRLDPSPVITLNRAIAAAELDGPRIALAAVDRLENKLAGSHAYHATRAELLRRLGDREKSRAAYDRAIELAENTAESAYLTRRRDQLASAPPV